MNPPRWSLPCDKSEACKSGESAASGWGEGEGEGGGSGGGDAGSGSDSDATLMVIILPCRWCMDEAGPLKPGSAVND